MSLSTHIHKKCYILINGVFQAGYSSGGENVMVPYLTGEQDITSILVNMSNTPKGMVSTEASMLDIPWPIAPQHQLIFALKTLIRNGLFKIVISKFCFRSSHCYTLFTFFQSKFVAAQMLLQKLLHT